MRSIIVNNMLSAGMITEEDAKRYSDLRVLQSGAGFYIGTVYDNPEGYTEPGSRESYHYYPTREEAEQALEQQSWLQRDHP
jgi:hypothetical protein